MLGVCFQLFNSAKKNLPLIAPLIHHCHVPRLLSELCGITLLVPNACTLGGRLENPGPVRDDDNNALYKGRDNRVGECSVAAITRLCLF